MRGVGRRAGGGDDKSKQFKCAKVNWFKGIFGRQKVRQNIENYSKTILVR